VTKKRDRKHERPIRAGLVSLGCAKNLVDAEVMLGSLVRGGVEITNDAGIADVVIVNTCSFIDAAQEESIDTILEMAELRETRRPRQALIVSGCLPQRFRDELPKLLPEVDAFMGIDQVEQVAGIVRDALKHRKRRVREQAKREHPKPIVSRAQNCPRPALSPADPAPLFDVTVRPQYIPDYATPRLRLTPKHFAYVKIAEGCNHPCSFCIIPRMRGTHRSRTQADIIQDTKQLITQGVKELNLISQDTTYYGLDLRPNHRRTISSPEKFNAASRTLPSHATTLCTLLRELNALPGDFWIRLLYTHPAHWTDALIQTMAECPKVARYVDMPLQHIHGNMLERMRRETSPQYIIELIAKIRASIPGIAIRTTFIVGFPGETEACFETLLDFIRQTRFERLGVFTYSHETGTPAAKMENQIPDPIKQSRRDLAMAAQRRVAQSISQSYVDRTIKVLVEQKANAKEIQSANIHSWEHGFLRERGVRAAKLKGEYLAARGEADAPDIDGRVYVRGELPLGEFADVRVIGHTDYDLIAEPA
jgi:ribosomal protein S12 methylthiotransferase